MNMKKWCPLMLCLAASSAGASDIAPYVTVFGGVDFGSKSHIDGHNPAGMVRDIDVRYKKGFVYGLAVGTRLYQGPYGAVSAELEYSGRALKTRRLSLNGRDRALNDGRNNRLAIDSYMANLVYESPYLVGQLKSMLGAGIGVAHLSYDVNYLVNNATPPTQIGIKSTHNPLAYQMMAGLMYDVTDHAAVYSNVKYFSVKDHNVNRYKLNNGAGLESVLNSSFKESWSLNVGVRYTF